MSNFDFIKCCVFQPAKKGFFTSCLLVKIIVLNTHQRCAYIFILIRSIWLEKLSTGNLGKPNFNFVLASCLHKVLHFYLTKLFFESCESSFTKVYRRINSWDTPLVFFVFYPVNNYLHLPIFMGFLRVVGEHCLSFN